MNTAKPSVPPHILLIEPDNLVRGTLVSVCRDLGLASVHQATSVSAGTCKLAQRNLQGIFIALDPEGTAMNLLNGVRAGQFACNAGLPMAVKSSTCTAEMVKELKALEVKRVLLQPFKLRDAILTLEQLVAATVAAAQTAPAAAAAAAEEAPPAAATEAAAPEAGSSADEPAEVAAASTAASSDAAASDATVADAAPETPAG